MMERRNETCNPLMFKVAALYKELQTAHVFLQNVVETLKKCDETSNFPELIGKPYIMNMPKFNILQKYVVEVKQRLRKVCSGEISLERAIEEAETMENYLDETLHAIRKDMVEPYCK